MHDDASSSHGPNSGGQALTRTPGKAASSNGWLLLWVLLGIFAAVLLLPVIFKLIAMVFGAVFWLVGAVIGAVFAVIGFVLSVIWAVLPYAILIGIGYAIARFVHTDRTDTVR